MRVTQGTESFYKLVLCPFSQRTPHSSWCLCLCYKVFPFSPLRVARGIHREGHVWQRLLHRPFVRETE